MFQISDTEKYLKVEFAGEVDFKVIHEAIMAEFNRPDYPHRNDIWVFEGGSLSLHFEQLARISGLIAGLYPAAATRTKTALVVPPGFNASVADLWIDSAKTLPYETRLFHGLKPAEDWINEPPVA